MACRHMKYGFVVILFATAVVQYKSVMTTVQTGLPVRAVVQPHPTTK